MMNRHTPPGRQPGKAARAPGNDRAASTRTTPVRPDTSQPSRALAANPALAPRPSRRRTLPFASLLAILLLVVGATNPLTAQDASPAVASPGPSAAPTAASPGPSAAPAPLASPTAPAPQATAPAATPDPASPVAAPSESLAPAPRPEVPAYTLAQVLDSARLNSGNLQLKVSELKSAQAGIDEANARFWPTLSATLSTSLMANPPEGIVIKAGSLGFAPSTGRYPTGLPANDVVLMPGAENTYFKIDTDLTWPVFTWGKRTNAADIARDQAGVAVLQVEKTTRENRRDLQKAYYGAVMGKEALAILEEMDSLFAQIVSDKEKGFQQGTVNLEGVLDSRSKRASLGFQRIKAQQSLTTALQGIAFLAGLPEGPWVPAESLPDPGTGPVLEPGALTDASRARALDQAILTLQTNMAEKALDIARNTELLHPDVGLSVKFQITGQRIPFTPNWIDTWDWNLIVSLGTQITLFDGGKQFAKVAQAEEQLNQARLGLSMTTRSLTLQVQKALESALTAQATLADKYAAQALARERDKNARAAFDNDMATREDARGAHIALLMSSLDLLSARYQFLTALADLEFLSGLPLL